MMASAAHPKTNDASTTEAQDVHPLLASQILATMHGQCIGDALGLLTEFMTKADAVEAYGKRPKDLSYGLKVSDAHRNNWEVGDWTDDTDQMILILQSLLYNKGETVVTDFAVRIKRWMMKGFPELGDTRGYGIGTTTHTVLNHPMFETNPEKVAIHCWESSQRKIAPNGSVMRTSIVGIHQWEDTEKVIENALCFGKATHYDPRCQAAVIAVSSCISLMLKHTMENIESEKEKKLDVNQLVKQCYELACRVLETDVQKQELWKHMNCKKIKDMKLLEPGKIGYTLKCMGAGFWAVRQKDFKKAMIELVMEGGDADTNGAVAGALLACKLGYDDLPQHWVQGLKHRSVLMDLYDRFIRLQSEMKLPVEERTDNNDLSVENLDIQATILKKKKK